MHVHILYVSSMCTELHSKNPIEMNENLREQLDNVYEWTHHVTDHAYSNPTVLHDFSFHVPKFS